MKGIIATFFLVFSALVFSQEVKKPVVKAGKTPKAEAKSLPAQNKRAYKFFKSNETYIKEPFRLRDPFKRKRLQKVGVKKAYGRLLVDDKFENLPNVRNKPLELIRITGILLGKDRRAIAKVIDGSKLSKETFILREGMKIGENNAEIKAILPGGIVLVEKIRNVYDQDEYIETIIPVSSEL